MRAYLLDWSGQALRWLQPIAGAAKQSGYPVIGNVTGISIAEPALEANWYAQIGH